MATLTKELEKLYQAHDRYEVLKDWFKITAITLNNQSQLVHDIKWQSREDDYLETVKRYTRDELDIFANCIAMLITIVSNDMQEGKYQDWLGDIYMRSCTASKEKAQHFTPYNVGKMMADINIMPVKDELKDKEIHTLNDPCVGGGCLPIAYCAALREHQINYQKQALVFAEDNDERCFYMSYIQLSLIGCPAVVQLKDTLLNKNLGKIWHTPALKWQWAKFQHHIPLSLRATQ